MQIRRGAAAVIVSATMVIGGLAGCSTAPDAVTDVTVSDAATVLAEPDVTVIDVRTAGEFAAGHLADAVNIDVEGGAFESGVADLPKDATYVVYCQSGNRSGVATDTLAGLGFTDVYDVEGGIAAWQAEGGPVVLD
ncbi:rhodanese-like domain-containing protein [Pengzhenrongella frigida]|uniref:Rhodanese-like domain-containing protein n=1 Tax=Pengzhenrongella frigida TaxID=1259133 RepID=A0A4Q5MY01_9MICO|nr:rhodanese-like domain-containing protein [Cellulomonas sp. HLT2-17]RYV50489.1 rhodanese-like domain-containing protein [Cellulomonas sp. HLT2-17]